MSDLAAQVGSPGLPVVGRLSSDERLTARAAAGDSRAFAAIFRRYHQDLYRYCAAILGDSQDAQDALQNTMVKVMRALPDERRQIRLKPWLYRIAHNESIDLVRARRQAQPLDPELEAPGAEPAEKAEQRARLRRLLVDLEDLPERQRGALLLRELAGLSFEEIGAVLGASSAVARQTIYEARLNLKQMNAGRETSCDAVTRALSDADGRVIRRRDIRAHLRQCEGCRAFREQINQRRGDLAAIAPLPAGAAAGILHAIAGGHGPGGGGGLLGAIGGGAGKAVGGSVALKSAAAVVAVVAVGAGVADRSGLIHVGSSGSGQAAAAGDRTSSGPSAVGGQSLGPAASKTQKGAAGAQSAGAAGSQLQQAPAAPHASADSPTQATVPPTAPSHQATAANEVHAPDGQAGSPGAAAGGRETAAAHGGDAGATPHPEPPPPPAHPGPESHPGTGKAPGSDGPPPAAPETGEAAAGGNPPKGPPTQGPPAEHGAGEAGAGAHGPAEPGPAAEPGPPAGHGPAEPG